MIEPVANSAQQGGVRQPSAAPGGRQHVPQINVLRVLALLGIFLHHSGKLFTPLLQNGIVNRSFAGIIEYSSLGVVFFNFITGFVLALPFLGTTSTRLPGYGEFLRRRFLRILPAYYLALYLFTVVNAIITGNRDFFSILSDFLTHALFLQALEYSTFFTNIAAYWYLSLLTQLYLMVPPLLWMFRRLKPARACLLLCVVCWGGCEILSLYLARHPDSSLGMVGFLIYFNLPARLPEFAMGMWLAHAWQSRSPGSGATVLERPFVAFAAAMLMVVLVGNRLFSTAELPFQLIYQVACCFVLFLVLFLWPSIAQLGGWESVTVLATASYSIYLVHQPLLSYLDMVFGGWLSPLARFTLLIVLGGPASYGLARLLDALSARIIERLGRAKRITTVRMR